MKFEHAPDLQSPVASVIQWRVVSFSMQYYVQRCDKLARTKGLVKIARSSAASGFRVNVARSLGGE
jgi:hypothetical protein